MFYVNYLNYKWNWNNTFGEKLAHIVLQSDGFMVIQKRKVGDTAFLKVH